MRNLKIIFITFICIWTSIPNVDAQDFDIKASTGYLVHGKANSIDRAYIKARENINFQIEANYKIGEFLLIPDTRITGSLLYVTSPTRLLYRPDQFSNREILNEASISYFMGGISLEYMRRGTPIIPFGGIKAGIMSVVPDTELIENLNRFALGLDIGLKIPIFGNFGTFTQINLFMPTQWSSDEIFSSTDSIHSNFVVNPGVILLQVGLNTGFYYKF